ncbi:MAG TPA: response regulator, partial [Puia sp.]|nr:response regulator [Puia sp.]
TGLLYVSKTDGIVKSIHLNTTVRALHKDKSGQLWVGTFGKGLLCYKRNSGQFTAYTEDNGLCNNTVLNIEEDTRGNIWVSTYNGISRLDPATGQFENFYATDGLQSNQFYYNASAHLTSGEIVFGGIKGFNIFHPDSIHELRTFPPLLITAIRVMNTPVDARNEYLQGAESIYNVDHIRLPYDQAMLSLDYVAPEYAEPEKIQYACYLTGWDKSWNYVNRLSTISYPQLREGDYVLRIKSTNASGVWNPKEKIIHVTILPPRYRSRWAYCLYILSGILSVRLYVSYRSRQKRLLYEVKIAKLTAYAEKAEREKEKVLIESERELNERRKDFFTSISHEFRTPLTLIVNPAKKLQEIAYSGGQKENLNTIYLNSKRLLSLVDQLLLFNKSESGFDTLRVSRQDLGAICGEVFKCFVSQAAARGLSFTFEGVTGEVPVYADKMKLEIILFNLLSNAVKFTPEGGSVDLRVEDASDIYNIYVSDTGEGIPPALGDQLFKKFGQAVLGTAAKKTGFGVGLYLARVFAEAHKGSLTFESRQGMGTIFHLILKKGAAHFQPHEIIPDAHTTPSLVDELYADAEAPADAATLQSGPVEEIAAPKNTLLVIDDDQQMLRYLVDIFRENYRILEAADGAAGLVMATKHTPDLVISDIHMGGISGIDLCRTLKETPGTAHIPVILLTGSQSDALRLEGVEGGADDYITKPFDSEVLLMKIKAILKRNDDFNKEADNKEFDLGSYHFNPK